MGKYAIHFDDYVTATSAKTAATVRADGSGDEAEIIELAMSGSGTSAADDVQHRARATFLTFATAGTPGASPTPLVFNQKSQAAACAGGVEHSAEPTVVGSTFHLNEGFNQRGGINWSVPEGAGIKLRNADASPGYAWQVISGAVGEVDGHVHWLEP